MVASSRRLGAIAGLALAATLSVPTALAVPGPQIPTPRHSRAGGVIASESLVASRAGRAVLDRGGNAIDAAVTAALTIGVSRPSSCGIGGGGFLVYRSAGGRIDTLDFRETAPARMRADTFAGPGTHTSFTGHRTVGVPGTVAGMEAALRRYGTISLREALTPAIRAAERGFRVPASLATQLQRNAERLARFPASARIFLPGGRPPAAGATLRQRDLADTLRRIAGEGPRAFYRGHVARSIARSMRTASRQLAGDIGLMTRADLARYKPRWRAPVTGSYRGRRVIGMGPPSSGGIAIQEMLNLLSGFDLKSFPPFAGAGSADADALHVQAEAQKIAWADRAAYVGDPAFAGNPAPELTSPAYADRRRAEISLSEARQSYPAGQLRSRTMRVDSDGDRSGSTTHLSVIDAQGSAVALTCTIEQNFGSAVTAPGTGVLLNNELTDFGAPGTANQPAPYKRPRSSMSPTIVVRDGRPELVVGGAGGSTIIMGVEQAITGMLDFGRTLPQALDAERIDAAGRGAMLTLEDTRLAPGVVDALAQRGHKVHRLGEYADAPRVNAAGIVPSSGLRLAASDARTDQASLASRRRAPKGSRTRADTLAPSVTSMRVRPAARRRALVRWNAVDGNGRVVRAVVLVRPRGAPRGTERLAAATRRERARIVLPRRGRFWVGVRVLDGAGNVSRTAHTVIRAR